MTLVTANIQTNGQLEAVAGELHLNELPILSLELDPEAGP